jgi:hypothetical protein
MKGTKERKKGEVNDDDDDDDDDDTKETSHR